MNASLPPRRSFADVDYAEAVRRAEALVPFLREQAAAGEQATHMPQNVVDALHASGLFRMQQPKRWGGMELDFPAYSETTAILGRGDASAALTFINLASHHRQLAMWAPRAQEEVWGDNPDALIASGIAYFQGKGRKVDGGIVMSGKWGFSSGVDPSTWNMLACIVYDGDKPVDWRMCVVPSTDYEILNDWQTLGMRGTGSRSVQCKDVFVPEHRALSMHIARPGHEFAGLREHTNPMFRVPTPAMGGYGIGGALLGNAQGALATMIDAVKGRSTSYTGAKMRDFPTAQLRIGMAAAKIDAGRVVRERLQDGLRALPARRQSRSRGAAAPSAQLRSRREAGDRSDRLAARAGRRQRHLRRFGLAADVSRCTRRCGAFRAQRRCAGNALGAGGDGRGVFEPYTVGLVRRVTA
jgi:3-hydroxy-9,10-secoandrosta-1,3,5(10)-triene-9,17-dione monooxygenase